MRAPRKLVLIGTSIRGIYVGLLFYGPGLAVLSRSNLAHWLRTRSFDKPSSSATHSHPLYLLCRPRISELSLPSYLPLLRHELSPPILRVNSSWWTSSMYLPLPSFYGTYILNPAWGTITSPTPLSPPQPLKVTSHLTAPLKISTRSENLPLRASWSYIESQPTHWGIILVTCHLLRI